MLLPAPNGMMSGDIALNCKSLFQSQFTLHRDASLQQGYFIFIKNSLCISGLLHRENGRRWQEGMEEGDSGGGGITLRWGGRWVGVSLAGLNDQDVNRFSSI